MDKNRSKKPSDGDDKVRRTRRPAKSASASFARDISSAWITKTPSVSKSTLRKTARYCRAVRPGFAPSTNAT